MQRNFIASVAVLSLFVFAAAVSAQSAPRSSSSATSEQSFAEYRNNRWHFSVVVPSNFTVEAHPQPGEVSETIQFLNEAGNLRFQVSAWPYKELDLALGAEASPGVAQDQPDTLGIVRIARDDMVHVTFVKNGISYLAQTLPEHEAPLLDMLRSWQFI